MSEATLAWWGVLPGPDVAYVARDVDDDLADRLGRGGPLLVVTGAPLTGASRAAARAARRMLGSARVVAPGRVTHVDVGALFDARGDATVLWLDGASLAVLDQLTPGLVDRARQEGVRIVVTTRPELVGADHPVDGTEALLRDATVVVDVLTVAEARGTPYRAGRAIGREVLPGRAAAAFVDPVGWSSLVPLAVATVAATWENLGVPLPLTPERLAGLTPVALARLGAAVPDEATIRATIRRCERGPVAGTPVLVATRRDGVVHLRPHTLVLGSALVGDRWWPRWLNRVLSDDDARVVARTAFARHDEETAVALLQGRCAAGLGPVNALRMATSGLDPYTSATWYRLALATDDPALLTEVRLDLARLLVAGWYPMDVGEARALLEAAAPDQRARFALGELEQSRGRTAEAWRSYTEAGRGPDADLAALAAWRAAQLALAADREEAALPLLERAAGGEGGAEPIILAGLVLGRRRRRRGDYALAEAALRAVLGADPARHDVGVDPAGTWSIEAVRAEARLELALIADDRGDDDAAATLYASVPLDPEAVLRLAELLLHRGRDDEALAALSRVPHPSTRERARMEERWDGSVPDLDAWQEWIAGEVDVRARRWDSARGHLERALTAPGARGRLAALRLGEIAVATGDARAAHRWLTPLVDGDDQVAVAARHVVEENAQLVALGARQLEHDRAVARQAELARQAERARLAALEPAPYFA